MSNYVRIDGQISGPFEDWEIEQRMRRGELRVDSPAWRMGMPEWATLGELLPEICAKISVSAARDEGDDSAKPPMNPV